MDEVDRKLLDLLQQDATAGMSQLAEQVGLSPTPVWQRIQKLEQAGIITKRVALIEPETVGIGLIVFVAIEAHEHTPEWLGAFAAAPDAVPGGVGAHPHGGGGGH